MGNGLQDREPTCQSHDGLLHSTGQLQDQMAQYHPKKERPTFLSREGLQRPDKKNLRFQKNKSGVIHN
jgi:hypothetical protein